MVNSLSSFPRSTPQVRISSTSSAPRPASSAPGRAPLLHTPNVNFQAPPPPLPAALPRPAVQPLMRPRGLWSGMGSGNPYWPPTRRVPPWEYPGFTAQNLQFGAGLFPGAMQAQVYGGQFQQAPAASQPGGAQTWQARAKALAQNIDQDLQKTAQASAASQTKHPSTTTTTTTTVPKPQTTRNLTPIQAATLAAVSGSRVPGSQSVTSARGTGSTGATVTGPRLPGSAAATVTRPRGTGSIGTRPVTRPTGSIGTRPVARPTSQPRNPGVRTPAFRPRTPVGSVRPRTPLGSGSGQLRPRRNLATPSPTETFKQTPQNGTAVAVVLRELEEYEGDRVASILDDNETSQITEILKKKYLRDPAGATIKNTILRELNSSSKDKSESERISDHLMLTCAHIRNRLKK